VVGNAEGNDLIQDISREDGNHFLYVVGIPGCDPTVRNGCLGLHPCDLRSQAISYS